MSLLGVKVCFQVFGTTAEYLRKTERLCEKEVGKPTAECHCRQRYQRDGGNGPISGSEEGILP